MLKCSFQYHRDQFDLEVEFEMQQQIVGVIGASGVGKSTFLKNIVGLFHPNRGHIQLNQRDLFNASSNITIPMHQREIALIFQNPLLFPHMTVLQNLSYAQKMQKHKKRNIEREFKLESVIQLLEIDKLLARQSHQLSGGESQRVSIGRALLSSPKLLLLDEPLSGLDTALKNQILPFLKKVNQQYQIPMIYVTHHLDELNRLNAQVYEMKKGVLSH